MRRMVGPVVQRLNMGGLLSVSVWAPHADSMTTERFFSCEFVPDVFCFQVGSRLHRAMDRNKSLSSPMSLKISFIRHTPIVVFPERTLWKRCGLKVTQIFETPCGAPLILIRKRNQQSGSLMEPVSSEWPYLNYWPHIIVITSVCGLAKIWSVKRVVRVENYYQLASVQG